MDKKHYILDTNILLSDPYSIYNFDDNVVILTEAIIEELDKFKKGDRDININARTISRELNKLRIEGKKNNIRLTDGIHLSNNGILKIESNHYDVKLPESWKLEIPDNRILQVGKYLKEQGNNVIIVSKDINIKIKADILGITAEDYENEKIDENYTGRREIYLSQEVTNEAFIPDNEYKIKINNPIYNEFGELEDIKFYPNEYLQIHKLENDQECLIGKISKDCEYIELILTEKHPYGISAKNIGQTFIIDALMRDTMDIPLVIVQGGSGTGKDFVSLACGLEQTFNTNKYRKILITREIQTLGKDLGALPGTEEEKLNPFLRGFMDNLEQLVDKNNKERYKNEKELTGKVQYLFDSGAIKAEAIAYMRGRSINKQYIIIDEAQNTTISQMKGILTRIGEDTKIVLLGDIKQIDNIYLDEKTNGLAWASQLLKESPYACQITLKDSESVRSNLVKDILKRL